MKYSNFIGIDVSKKTLDIGIVDLDGVIRHFTINNELSEISFFLNEHFRLVSKRDKSLFCLESTGVYGELLLKCLANKKIDTWVVNPVHIKRSMGMVRGKSDKIDSIRIAQFAMQHTSQVRLYKASRPILKTIKALSRTREMLVKCRTQLKQTMTESKFEDPEIATLKREAIDATFEALKADIKSVEKQIETIIHQDNELARKYKIACSVIGIGPITAIETLIVTNEFLTITEPKKFACHSGVAPFPNSSGTSLKGRTRVSQMANKKMKRLLHLAALSSIRYHGEIRQYYLKKVAEGKHKMSVLNAVRNKIINRLFACIKQDKLYDHCLVLS